MLIGLVKTLLHLSTIHAQHFRAQRSDAIMTREKQLTLFGCDNGVICRYGRTIDSFTVFSTVHYAALCFLPGYRKQAAEGGWDDHRE